MPRRLALVHTVGSLPPVFDAIASELAPDVELVHLVDESLLEDAISAGRLTADVRDRLRGEVADVAADVDAVLVTCSSVGPAVEIAARENAIPVLRVDQPMVDEAVGLGRRIGVLATLSTTLEPTAELVRRRAAKAGHADVTVEASIVDGAFSARSAGDLATHDRLVADALRDLATRVDVVLLAQASMARVADCLPAGSVAVPILSSPRSGLAKALAVVGEAPTSAGR